MSTSRTRTRGSSSDQEYSIPILNRRAKCVGFWDNGVRKYRWDNLDDLESQVLGVHRMDDTVSISDFVGSPGNYNPCTHRKWISYKLPHNCGASIVHELPTPQFGYLDQEKVFSSVISDVQGVNKITFQTLLNNGIADIPDSISTPIDWSTLVSQVGEQLDGTMTTGQNMLVSMAQMAQVVGMVKNPLKIASVPKLLRRRSLGEISKYAASGYLEYQFGWKNLYRDIVQLARVYEEVRRHTEYLRRTAHTYVRVAAGQRDRKDNPSIAFDAFGHQNGIRFQPVVDSIEREAHFTLDIYRNEAALLWSKMDQVINRLGGRDVALALWDLVPYSFVVDWFTHVNRIIERKPILWNTFKVRRVGYSTKTTVKGHVVSDSIALDSFGSAQKSLTHGTEIVQEKYERIAGFPPQSATVGLFGSLTHTQLAEGAALILQRL